MFFKVAFFLPYSSIYSHDSSFFLLNSHFFFSSFSPLLSSPLLLLSFFSSSLRLISSILSSLARSRAPSWESASAFTTVACWPYILNYTTQNAPATVHSGQQKLTYTKEPCRVGYTSWTEGCLFVRYPWMYSVDTLNDTTHNASADSTLMHWGQSKQSLICFSISLQQLQCSSVCVRSSLATDAASRGLTPQPHRRGAMVFSFFFFVSFFFFFFTF